MKHFSFSLLIFLLSSLVFAGGRAEAGHSMAADAAFPLSLEDSRGQAVTVAAEPKRIISLGPNMTEIIFALGKGDALAGRTDWCDYPAEAAAVPSVGSLQEPSVESILALQPDLVIASTHAPLELMALMEEAGVATAGFIGHETYEGVYDVIIKTGRVLGAGAAAETLVESMKERAARVSEAALNMSSRPRVYFVVGFAEGGDWTATGDTFIHQMITLAGGENIAADASGWSYSLERLIQEDPDLILMNRGMKDAFISTPLYRDLRAVKEGRVFEVDENIIVRQGPRLIDGLELLHRLFNQ
jgi:iron complex transport system substrate-binding protein